TYLVSGGSL
ncbi:PE family protein PE29, partial [Mycobacterium tuberculosis M2128]